MRPRVSTDTSVLGGCEDEELRVPSRRLLQTFQRGERAGAQRPVSAGASASAGAASIRPRPR